MKYFISRLSALRYNVYHGFIHGLGVDNPFGHNFDNDRCLCHQLKRLVPPYLETRYDSRFRGACANELNCRRFLPDVCSYRVSPNVSVSVDRRVVIVSCRDLPITLFSFKRLGFERY